jgi:hypothetical protein
VAVVLGDELVGFSKVKGHGFHALFSTHRLRFCEQPELRRPQGDLCPAFSPQPVSGPLRRITQHKYIAA